jgi:hypothetical protein
MQKQHHPAPTDAIIARLLANPTTNLSATGVRGHVAGL